MSRGYRVWDNQEKTYSDKAFSIDQLGLCYVQDEDGYWEEIDDSRFIVEFETGLTDKNVIMIYDGDILQIDDHIVGDFEVLWHNLAWKIKRSIGYETLAVHKSDDIVVIGNIHESPELIGGEE